MKLFTQRNVLLEKSKKGVLLLHKFILLFAILLLGTVGCNQSEGGKEMHPTIDGFWKGEIEIPNQPLKIEVTLSNQEELLGTISIPIQGVEDYPLSNVTYGGKQNIHFTMEIQNQLLSFEGEVKPEQIIGTFTQNGQSFPFQLTKGEPVETESESGEYIEMETDTGTLFAEVELPKGKAPFPVMLIIPGSGQTDRNGNSVGVPGKNDSLKLLAEELAQQGIASIRYDKRGVGKNLQAAVDEADMRFQLFVNDAVNWIQKLETDDRFSTIGIIGHSQGSLVGMLAAKEATIDTFISIAGPGHSLDKELGRQLKEQLSEPLMKEANEILASLTAGETVDHVSRELQAVFRPSVQPFLISWMQYDPKTVIAELGIPRLIIQGSHDIQVPEEDATLLQEAAPESEVVIVEDMNHVLKQAPMEREKNIQTYSQPDLPLASGLMDGITGFLKKIHFAN